MDRSIRGRDLHCQLSGRVQEGYLNVRSETEFESMTECRHLKTTEDLLNRFCPPRRIFSCYVTARSERRYVSWLLHIVRLFWWYYWYWFFAFFVMLRVPGSAREYTKRRLRICLKHAWIQD